MSNNYQLSHLEELESESIYIIREVFAQFNTSAILFSGGKDSIVLSILSKKAFWPAKIPFPLVHIDTGQNFPETMAFRDQFVTQLGVELIVGSVQESIDSGEVVEEIGIDASRNALQTTTLLSTIKKHQFDCCLGGARRDEEKARAKERVFSHRNALGEWEPKTQRPELWNIFNGRKKPEEHFRVFPLSNWTELDIWQYIKTNNIALPSLYFAHQRQVFDRNGAWIAVSPYVILNEADKPKIQSVRYRTCGDMPITGATLSNANSVDEVITELLLSNQTERGSRADDRRSETAMEDRKRQGYF